MNTLTGNNANQSANRPQLTTLTDMIYPGISWSEQDYASLQASLHMYEDFIVLSRYRDGQTTEQQIVDPGALAVALSGINLTSGLLPENTLFWSRQNGAERLAVYLPPRVWLVAVRNNVEEYGPDSGQAWRVPLPGLVFVGHEYNYSMWAVKERPVRADTPVFPAPCPNTHPGGVCRGNAPFPLASPATIYQAVDVFFGSRFNHDLGQEKSRAHPERILDQWYELNESGAEAYPLDDLVENRGMTMRGVLDV